MLKWKLTAAILSAGVLLCSCGEPIPEVPPEETAAYGADAPEKQGPVWGREEILALLWERSGQQMLSGQYASSGENKEIQLIEDLTGERPAIRAADLRDPDGAASSLAWALEGGIPSLIWHWEAPSNQPGIYSADTDFDLSQAVTSVKVAGLTLSEAERLAEEGKIPQETAALLRDIDVAASQLAPLKEAGAGVLWRPLHEAGGGWFWWGAAGKEPYLWLWDLLYQRMTEFHGLDHLIWVWNGVLEEWYPENCDMVSFDLYGEPEPGFDPYLQLYQMTEGKKLIAASEVGILPDLAQWKQKGELWSWCALWYGEYLMDENGEFSGQYTSKEDLLSFYHSDMVITLERLREFLK